MNRRDFLALTGATAAAWPLAARAQRALPLVAVYNINTVDVQSANYLALFAGMAETGLAEGRDFTVERFYAAGQADKLPDLIAAALQREPAVIIASGGILPVQTAQKATSTVPIVFTSGVDPVSTGVVRTMNRPGGNITGVYILGRELDPKRLEVLHDLVPAAKRVAVISNPKGTPPDFKSISAGARQLGLELQMAEATSDADLDGVYARFDPKAVHAVLACSDPVLTNAMWRAAGSRARATRLPGIIESRPYPDIGGFASYGPNVPDVYRVAGTLVGQILKGTPPADLPVLQPIRFELVINNKTAKALGLTIPPTALFRADEVIE